MSIDVKQHFIPHFFRKKDEKANPAIISNISTKSRIKKAKFVKFIHQLPAIFTCRDSKGVVLSSQASKMLYQPPGAVYITSYKESLD